MRPDCHAADASLPVIATDAALVAAVVEEIERTILWRAIVRQTRLILIDGASSRSNR